jgi:hypothetical protein
MIQLVESRLHLRESLSCLLAAALCWGAIVPQRVARGGSGAGTNRGLSSEEATAGGFQVLRGGHIELILDRPIDREIAELPAVFDQAVDLWTEFFSVDPARVEDWNVRACVMRERRRFTAAGLLPEEIPAFRHGYALGRKIWLDDQPTDYYRRHLLLHEGVHSFMDEFLGACGPPWWMEGMAELLATHRWKDSQLVAPYFPADRSEVPMLGRIKLVREAVRSGRALSIESVLQYDRRAHVENAAYAWSWALVAFLHRHPRYSPRMMSLLEHSADPRFNLRVRELYAVDWRELNEEWALFAATLEHGHDIPRTTIDFRPGSDLADDAGRLVPTITVHADRGWQNSGLRLRMGARYTVQAKGRFLLDHRPADWWSEPGGVTIRYCRGKPLGMLLAAVWSPERPLSETSPFLDPLPIGERAVIEPRISGTLFFCVNDLPSGLSNNRGSIEVTVRAGEVGAD